METNEMKRCNIPELQQIHRLKEEGKTIVFVNGCFDLFHAGHLALLEFAKTQGDVLVVGVNSDQSIKCIKGTVDNVSRPIINEKARLRIVQALKCVDFALLFDERDPSSLIELIKPKLVIKGSDHKLSNLGEQASLTRNKCQVVWFDRISDVSTSKIIKMLRE